MIKEKNSIGWRLSATKIEASLANCVKEYLESEAIFTQCTDLSPAEYTNARNGVNAYLAKIKSKTALNLVERVDLGSIEVSIHLKLRVGSFDFARYIMTPHTAKHS